ncbi:MAG TPA: signal recognition particle-docking protein FtsY, partial [Rhodobiaceae bacterium]|nr:signal recognition particle-docking protein FtsY [Rhodobiaceae bacterium]
MGIFDRLKTGLSRSSRALGENLGSIIGRRRLDKET